MKDSLIHFDYNKNKKNIFDKIISEIALANKHKESSIYIKQLLVANEEIDVIADKKDWPDCLNKALAFYKSNEDYESCGKCQNLLDKINELPKKTKSNARKTK